MRGWFDWSADRIHEDLTQAKLSCPLQHGATHLPCLPPTRLPDSRYLWREAMVITFGQTHGLQASQLQCMSPARYARLQARASRLTYSQTLCALDQKVLQAAVSSLACACIALVPNPAAAYNVRLEDVENEHLQSGKIRSMRVYVVQLHPEQCTRNCRHA